MSAQDLKKAYITLFNKQRRYTDLFDYYDGEQPLVYLASRLKEIFKDLDAYFAENWCSVVIDSARDRINLNQIQIKDTSAATVWKEVWERCEVKLESDDVHEAAMVSGEGYIIAWPNEDGQMELYANDPRMVHVFYDPEYPRKKQFAAKWWVDKNGYRHITLYYAETLEYYVCKNKEQNGGAISETGWKNYVPPDPAEAPNKYHEVPVFHYRLGKRKAKSDLKNVIPIQNGINKLLTDMMVTAEYAAFPQRYLISNSDVSGKLKNAPNEVWDLPAGDGMSQQTQAGQFAAAELKNYLEGIDNLATAISSITRTPKHYFFSIGSNLSGEALIAMEAPLNKKAKDRIDRFVPVWQQVVLFVLKAANIEKITSDDISPIFDKPETIQPYTLAQTRQANVQAGMPLKTILRDEGKSEAYISQLEADLQQEKTRNANVAKAYLDQARTNFDQGQTQVNNA